MYSIALTGGIASGKSTIAEHFAELGVPIIDTDIIARKLVEPGASALKEISSLFGADIIATDGTLERSKLRNIIFNNNAKRKKLEAILHPRIRTDVFKQVNLLNEDYCIIVVPLLFETDYPYPVDRVLVVDISPDKQLSRLLTRDAIDETIAKAIIDAQVSSDKRLARADDVINNDMNIEAVKQQVKKLHHEYLILSSQTKPS